MCKIVDSNENRKNFFFELECHTSLMALERTIPITTHANKLNS
jgi:hypothetical protein